MPKRYLIRMVKVALVRPLSEKNRKVVEETGAEVAEGEDFDADIVLVRNRLENFSRYENLRWIHASYSGVNALLTDEVKESDVIVTNSSGIHSITIPEHAMGMILSHFRRLKQAAYAQKERKWRPFEDAQELHGRTVGIIGVGHIGSAVAERCKAFGCRTVGIRRSGKSVPSVDKMLRPDGLKELLQESDVVVVSVPFTAETRSLLGKEEFFRMKKGALLVNLGRGDIIDEEAMISALREKKISACLDVFPEEPLPEDSLLWNMENVLITAHYSAITPHYEDRMMKIFLKNLKAFMSGEEMENVVDKERGY